MMYLSNKEVGMNTINDLRKALDLAVDTDPPLPGPVPMRLPLPAAPSALVPGARSAS